MKLINLYIAVIAFIITFANAKVEVLTKKNFDKVCLHSLFILYVYIFLSS